MSKHVTSRYADWKEGRTDRTRIERHLAECPACRRYYERMNGLFDPAAAADLPRLVPDPYLPGRIAAIADARGGMRTGGETARSVLFSGALCFAAAVIGVFLGVIVRPEPPQEDLDEIVTLYRQAVSGDDFSGELVQVLEESGGDAE